MPKVSIIMPAYNVEKYIRECMDSVVKQTLEDIEIIVVDDGSTDSTGRILDGYAETDRRIRVIHKENSGYGASMNMGLKEAKGEYIGIVETDDFAESDMFELLYDTAKKFDADAVKCNYFKYYSQKEPQDRFFECLKDVYEYYRPFAPKDHPVIFKVSPSIWSGIYRRSMITDNDIRFLETPGASYQDTGFAFKIWSCAEKAVLVDKALLHYRLDNEGSSVNNEKKVFCVCDEYREIERFLNEKPERIKNFDGIMNMAKFGVYLWNYDRVGFEYKYAFLMKMKEELLEADKASRIDRANMTERQNKRLDDILYNYTTEEYLDIARKKLLGEFRSISELARAYNRLTEPPVKKAKRIAKAGLRRIKKLSSR